MLRSIIKEVILENNDELAKKEWKSFAKRNGLLTFRPDRSNFLGLSRAAEKLKSQVIYSVDGISSNKWSADDAYREADKKGIIGMAIGPIKYKGENTFTRPLGKYRAPADAILDVKVDAVTLEIATVSGYEFAQSMRNRSI